MCAIVKQPRSSRSVRDGLVRLVGWLRYLPKLRSLENPLTPEGGGGTGVDETGAGGAGVAGGGRVAIGGGGGDENEGLVLGVGDAIG